MEILKSIKIKNYRSFLDEKIDLDSIITFIGANESGKSNILQAINHLSREKQRTDFDIHEQNLGVVHAQDNFIEIEYEIILNKNLIPILASQVPNLINKKVRLTKKGKPKTSSWWGIVINDIPKTGNMVLINGNKLNFKNNVKDKYPKEKIDEWVKNKYFFSNQTTNLSQNPFYSMKKDGLISVLDESEKNEKIGKLILDEVLENIQIYFWIYNELNYLKEMVSLEEFCKKPKMNESVYGIFKIAENENAFNFKLSPADLEANLFNANSSHRSNLLNEIAKKFNRIFDRSWRTYFGKRITIEIGYESTNLTFRFYDGRVCPPEYRSDGLKWFLTFLINFQSKQKELSDYILLMDEPGGLLHPQGQKDVLSFLLKLSEKNQIIYSTHQTFLIDKNSPEKVRILDRREKDRKIDFWPTHVHSIKNNKEHILKDSLLRESLGFTLSDVSPINERNILVEGVFDRNILQYCNERFKTLDFNYYSIISCGKASNIVYSANLFESNGLRSVCLYDNDGPGQMYYDNSEIPDKNKIFTSEVKGETIEDIIPDDIVKFAFNALINDPKFKTYFKGQEVEFSKPFIANTFEKQLNEGIDRSIKKVIKHRFEDILFEKIKESFTEEDFNKFGILLRNIKDILDK